MNKPTDVEAYIAGFSPAVQKMLRQLRGIVQQSAPGAKEVIAYGMPTYKSGGNLLHFAAFKSHIGFYPTPSGIASFKTELQPFVSAKGSVQFPLNEPLPLELIKKMVEYRVAEAEVEALAKKPKTALAKKAAAKKWGNVLSPLVAGISAPAQRALAAAGITSLKGLSRWTEGDLLALHGIGPTAIPKIKQALEREGLSLKK